MEAGSTVKIKNNLIKIVVTGPGDAIKHNFIKIVVTGPGDAGKTSLFKRFAEGIFVLETVPTIGIDFNVRNVTVNDREYKVQLWDTAGHERFHEITKRCLRGVHGVILVYDITNGDNFIQAEYWLKDFRKVADVMASEILIVGNKCDLENKRKVSRLRGYQFACKYGAKFSEVSAKTGDNAEESFQTLLRDILVKHGAIQVRQVPKEFREDPYALNLYEKALVGGKEKDRSLRINVVGNYRQGKTSLTRRLVGKDIKKVESTNGIMIEHFRCKQAKDGMLHYVRVEGNLEGEYVNRVAKVAVNYGINDEEPQDVRRNEMEQEKEQEKDETNSFAEGFLINKIQKVTTAEETVLSNRNGKTQSVSNKTLETKQGLTSMSATNEFMETKLSFLSNDQKDRFAEALLTIESSPEIETLTVFDIWDFGGQSIFYATHSIFHSRQAIYLLVFDLSLDLSKVVTDCDFPACSEERNMEYYLQFWMNSIHSFVGTEDGYLPKVILVGTHKDKLKGKQSEREKYIKKYFNDVRRLFDGTELLNHILEEDFAVDNTVPEDSSITCLRQTIGKIGEEQLETLEIPLKWIQLEKLLTEKKPLKLISIQFVIAIDGESEYPLGDVEQVKLFLRYHHAKGTFVYFDEEPISEYAILDPQYLIDAFKTIITSRRFCTNNPRIRPYWTLLLEEGRLEDQLIERQWGDPEVADQMYIDNKKILLSFLIKHHIISEATAFDEETEQTAGLGWYVVPSLLQSRAVNSESEIFCQGKKHTRLGVVFLFNKSPLVPTIYHRLISAVIGKWSLAKLGKKTLLFKDLCILRLNIDHAAIVEMKTGAIELSVVSLCPTVEINAEQADQIRRFSEAVISFEFRKLKGSDETLTKPYEIWFRCKHGRHGAAGSEHVISLTDLDANKVVPCPDLESHEIYVHKAKGEWFQDFKRISEIPHAVLTDKLLGRLSQCIGENWHLLGLELGLTKVQLDHITEDHPHSAILRIYTMLQHWGQEAEGATIGVLVQAMQKCSKVTFDWDILRNILDELK